MPRYQRAHRMVTAINEKCSVMVASDGSLIYSMISFNGDIIRL